MRKGGSWTALIVGALSISTAVAGELRLLPEQVQLTGSEARHRVRAFRFEDGFAGPVEKANLKSGNPKVVKIDSAGTLIAVGNGETTVTALASDGSKATTAVRVKGIDVPHEWSFRNHVQPVLMKGGCNSGACHGALAGKGGFTLSLRGYDPEGDFFSITRGARGRRVEVANPAYSLLLTKPTAATRHKGGKVIDPNSRDYRILAEWVAAGAKGPTDEDARLDHIEVLPEQSLLKVGDKQPLIVRAHYNDGRVEDVTHWAKFTSSNEVVAFVDDKTGIVSVVGHGEGAVTAWFDSKIVIARVTSPFENQIAESVYSKAERRNFIDDLVLAQLNRLNLKPSPRTNDSEFIRRVYLDTIGVLPTAEETGAFLASKESNKRGKVIDHLLSRPEFVDYWSYRWADLLMINGRLLRPEALKSYYMWLRGCIESNTPWDEIARQLVTATGSSLENGATNFFAVNQDPETMAENVSQTFLALSINCAKCHNHPLEKWTNDQYYGFANLFARVRGKGWGGDPRNGDGMRTLYVEPRGDLIQPRTGKPQIPAPLDGEPLTPDATDDRREHLAEWLTSPDNPYFTRAVANRVWAAFFGIGIVDPVDDLRASNPASNEPLLASISDHLAKSDYDLKSLMRTILQSETYQRSSMTVPENESEERYFSHYYPRRLMAEVLYDAISNVSGVPGDFNAVKLQDGSEQKTEFYPKGTRALQLYDSAVSSYFLKTFGRNERAIACECERSNQPSMVQVLHLSNGVTVNDKLTKKESRASILAKDTRPNAAIIEDAYLSCLSRKPTPQETSQFEKLFADTPEAEKQMVVEDLFWALMTSREFLFQH